MTVDAVVPVVVFPFTGPGNYPFTYQVYEDTDVSVTHYDATTGEPQILVLNTDYTVTLVEGVVGGTVVITWSDKTGGSLEVLRVLPYTQETSWPTNSPFSPRLLERDLDYATMLVQQNKEAVDRSLKLQPGASGDYTLPLPVPDAVIAIWDPTGQFLIIGPTADQISNAQGYANAAAASAALAQSMFTTARSWIKIQNYVPVALTITGGAVDWNGNDAPSAVLTLTENVTLNQLQLTLATYYTNLDTTMVKLRVINSGSYTIAFHSSYIGGAVAIPQPAVNGRSVYIFEWDEVNKQALFMSAYRDS